MENRMLLYLNGAFVGLLVLSNILAVKLVQFGSWAVLPAAVIVYVCTYPITDTIAEVYGKQAARHTVTAGLVTQLLAVGFIYLAIQLPAAAVFPFQEEYATILSAGFRVTAASILSYLISQNLDVSIFHFFKRRHGTEKLWIRNNISTMASQLADTTLFIVIAFYGTVPVSALAGMILTQYVWKCMAALLDTPLVYMLVRICRKERGRPSSAIAA